MKSQLTASDIILDQDTTLPPLLLAEWLRLAPHLRHSATL